MKEPVVRAAGLAAALAYAAAIAWLIDLLTRKKKRSPAVNYAPNSGREELGR